MSPERMLGEVHSYASDIWSLGLTVLEAFLGVMPYPAATTFMQQMQMVVDGPTPAAEGGSPQFEEFVAMCLEKDAGARGSIAELLTGGWLNGVDDAEFGRWLAAS